MINFVVTILGVHVASVLGASDCETQAECMTYTNYECADVVVVSGNYRDDPRVCTKLENCGKNVNIDDGSVVRFDCLKD